MRDEGWVEAVHEFWFGLAYEEWFGLHPELDGRIRREFSPLHAELAANTPPLTHPRQSVALTVALDQFPRNMYRGHPAEYATDPVALARSLAALDAGFDAALSREERLFLYMPLQHSESLEAQERSVALFAALGIEDAAEAACEHRDIIRRFGRFPHRNAILGRRSTREEMEFLETARPFQ
jgi:uncharacterized protein (DUF924 family)